jgi:hypothetical protein
MHLARGLPLRYNQQEIDPHWRPYIASSILHGVALPR